MKTTTEELLAFVTVIDRGSITAAAETLQQTVSGVSRALTRLEKKLDATLIRRTTRRLQLTAEGERFLQHARDIIAAVETAEASVSPSEARPAGRLRVDAASPFVLHCIVPHVQAFAAAYPDIVLELSSHERVVDLIEKRVDIAIRIGPLQDSSLRARSLGNSRRQLLASPAYLAAQGIPTSIDALLQHRLIGFSAPEQLNDWPLRDPKHADREDASLLHITPTLSATSGETIRQLTLAGNGISCLSTFMTHADIAQDRLIPLLERDTLDLPQPIHAVFYRHASMDARSRVFLDFFADRLVL